MQNRGWRFYGLRVLACGAILIACWSFLKPIARKYYRNKVEDARIQWVESIGDNVLGSRFFIPCDNDDFIWYLKLRRKKPRIQSGNMDAALLDSLKRLIALWPPELSNYMNNHVREVWVVKNLGASGHIFTHDNATFTIVIDESVIGMKPNDWFRKKENTIVDLDRARLHHRIEHDSVDVPERLLESILIHELAHCIGISEGWTTDIEGRTELPEKLSVFEGVFELPESRPVMKDCLREKFPQLRYYKSEDKLTESEYVELLRLLGNSEFPSLYGTVSDLEFFAEYFYAYVHCQIQNRPFSYTVVNENDTLVHINTPIFEQMNAQRLQLMAEVFDGLRESDSQPKHKNAEGIN